MEPLSVAWAAGFLDGEGCFNLGPSETRRGDRVWPSYRAYVKANQVVEAPIQKLHDLFGGRTWRRGTNTVTGKPVFEWQIQGGPDLRRVLPLLIPHLIVKKAAAELLLEFAQTIGRRAGRGGTPPKILIRRKQIYKRYDLAQEHYAQA